MIFCFYGFEDNITNLSADKLFGLDNFTGKIFTVDIGADKNKLYNRTILPSCKIACQINTPQVTQPVDNLFNNPVYSCFLQDYVMYVPEKRMLEFA